MDWSEREVIRAVLWVTGNPCKIAVNGFDSHTVHQSLECVQQKIKNIQNLFETRSFDFPVKKVETHSVINYRRKTILGKFLHTTFAIETPLTS